MTKEAIIKGLKTVAGVDKDKARLFADVIRDIIVEGLTEDGTVKIKGLGTFKVVEVKSRKSVDVNTGAEIEIPAHKKVTFTAENKLADEINEPLAHLEVVNLGAGTEVDETEQKYEVVVEQEMISAENAKDEAMKKLAENAENLKDVLAMINGTINADTTSDVQEQPAEPELPSAEPDLSSVEPELSSVEPELPPVVEQEKPECIIQEPSSQVDSAKFVQPQHRPYEYQPIDLGPTSGKKNNVFLRVVIIVVAALLLCSVGVWIFIKLGERPSSDIADRSGKNVVKVEPITEEERLAEIERIKAEVREREAKQGDTAYVYSGVKRLHPEESMPMDNALAVIRVKEGDRLMTLSKQYYGHKMFWVYIYDANKSELRNPDELRVGMVLVIPRMDKKLLDVENEESVRAAMELEAKFMNR